MSQKGSIRMSGWFIGNFNGSFSTSRLYRAIGISNILWRAGRQDKYTVKQSNNTLNREKRSSARAFWRQSPRHDQSSSEESFQPSTENLTRTTNRQNTQKRKSVHKTADIARERKNLFYRCNMLIRRFYNCSVAVKQRLFKGQCQRQIGELTVSKRKIDSVRSPGVGK